MILYIGFLLIIFVIIGINDFRHKSLKSYTVGMGEKFSTKEIISTVFATAIGSGATVGAVSMIYKEGLLYAVPKLLTFIYWLILANIFASRIWKFQGCDSLSDIMMQLYGKSAKYITSIGTTIVAIGTISAQITAAGYLLEYFNILSFNKSVIVVFAAILMYTALGGIKSVIKTDFVQMCIFGIALPIAYGAIYRELDSIDSIFHEIQIKGIDNITNNVSKFFGLLFLFIFPGISAPYIQRMLIVKERIKNISIFKWVAFFIFLLNVFLILMAFTIKARAPNLPANSEFYFFVKNYLSKEMSVVVILAILSVIFSTADSWLNTSATMLSKDIVISLMKMNNDKYHILIVRVITFVLGVMALIISIKNKLILEVIWFVKNFWSPIILVPLITGFLGIKTKKHSFLIGCICGIVGVISGFIIYKKLGLESLMMGVVFNALGFFGRSLIVYGAQIFKKKNHTKYIHNYIMRISAQNKEPNRLFLSLNFALNIPLFVYIIATNNNVHLLTSIILQVIAVISLCYRKKNLYRLVNLIFYVFAIYLSFHHYIHKNSVVLIGYVLLCTLIHLIVNIYCNIKKIKEDNFLLIASLHDAGSAIVATKNNIFLFKEQNNKNQELVKKLDNIVISLNKVHKICKESLVIKKEYSGIAMEFLELKTVLQESLDFYSKIGQKNIKVCINLEESKKQIFANNQLICRVIGILLNNSVDALSNTLQKKININSKITKNKLKLYVTDNGEGIKKEDIPFIFKKGFSSKENGFGIGLAFVKVALAKMNVEIKCKSTYREGTTMILIFQL